MIKKKVNDTEEIIKYVNNKIVSNSDPKDL